MRLRSLVVLGSSALLLSSSAWAAGPELRQERHWLFGHRCGVSFDDDGPRAWLVPNETFEVEGFSSVWSDPLDGSLLLYSDGRDVWRGADHQRIHQGGPGPLRLQPAVLMPLPVAGEGAAIQWFGFLAIDADVNTPWDHPAVVSIFESDGTHRLNRELVPTRPRALMATAGVIDSEIVSALIARRPTSPLNVERLGLWSSANSGTVRPNAGEHLHIDGDTTSQSRSGDRVVFVHSPGYVRVNQYWPAVPSAYEPQFEADVLAAHDTGRIHHTMLSPDGSKLYVGVDDGVDGERAEILQVELADGQVTSLGFAYGTHSPSFGLAPDGLIYVGSAQPDTAIDVLGAITAPDELGDAAGFEPAALTMAAGCDVRRGLVNFVSGGMRLLDTDRDGMFDGDDSDVDNDGIPDSSEAGPEYVNHKLDLDLTGQLGWNYPNAISCAVAGNDRCAVLTDALDPDGDGLPSPSDLDSDGDGIPDLWECGGLALDADHDGRIDGPVSGYTGRPVAELALPCPDTDGDEIPDWLDLDSDNDGIPDRIEASGATGADRRQSGWADDGRDATLAGIVRDTDGDGIPDWLDPHDDRVPDAGPGDELDAGADGGEADEDAGVNPVVDASDASDADHTPPGPDAAGTPQSSSSSGSSDPSGDEPAAGEGDAEGTRGLGGGCTASGFTSPPSASWWLLLWMVLRRRLSRRQLRSRTAAPANLSAHPAVTEGSQAPAPFRPRREKVPEAGRKVASARSVLRAGP